MASILFKMLILGFTLSISLSSAKAMDSPILQFPHTFTYEAQTPQRVNTGCRGTFFPESKETHKIFYIVDASGTMKFVEPGSIVQVIFPFATDGTTHHPHKRQMVRFTEICFPSQCKAPSCGSTLGPLTYSVDPNLAGGGATSEAANWVQGVFAQEFVQAGTEGGNTLLGLIPQSLPTPSDSSNSKAPMSGNGPSTIIEGII